jgi:exopolysaccharide production protein ExoZ
MHRAKIEAVQALRAIAALSIAILHVLHDAGGLDPSGMIGRWHNALPWDAGVDLFFVISGFVMVYASSELFGRRDGATLFMARRLIRIVPLYWAATTVFLLIALTARSVVTEGAGSIVNILMSYAFLPSRGPDGAIQPIYSLGWTLNYEMFFYVVFAAFIWQVRHRALILVTLTLGAAIAVHPLIPADATALVFWTDPIVAEFLFGMAIAALATTGIGLSRRVSVGLALLALLWLIGGYVSGIGGSRPVTTGLPVAILVSAAVFGRNIRLPTALVLLGDSSFALYLVHPFAMRAVQLFWHWLRLTGPGAAVAYAASSLLLAIAVSVAVYEWFERPIGASLRARLAERRARRAPLPSGAT